MSNIVLLGVVMPTDAAMPHPAIADAVADMEAECDYTSAVEGIMCPFQWSSRDFEISISGTLSIRRNDGDYPYYVDNDVTISHEPEVWSLGGMNVMDRMFSTFPAGEWVGFTAGKKTGTIPLSGSVLFADDGFTEYHMTNMQLSYTIEVGRFTANPSAGIIGDAHLIQHGTSYKIPFRVNVIFLADTNYYVEGVMQTVSARASTVHGSDIYVPAALEHEVGGAGVGNGSAELFNPALGGGFSVKLWGPSFGPTAPNTIFFSELNIGINATSLAALPASP